MCAIDVFDPELEERTEIYEKVDNRSNNHSDGIDTSFVHGGK